MRSKKSYSKILIYRNNGQIWSFFAFENSLYYEINHKNIQNKKIKLVDNIKDYDVTVDAKDDIHLVYTCMNNELSYLKYTHNDWIKSIFYQPYSKLISDNINIFAIKDAVHIFITSTNSKRSLPSRVYHIHSLNNQWQFIQLSLVSLSEKNLPFFVDYNFNHNIIFLCKSRLQKKNKVYFKIFKPQTNSWSLSTELKFKEKNIDIKNFLIDSKGNLHFLYEHQKNIFYANHVLKDISLNSVISLTNSSSIGDKIGIDYQLYEMNNEVWVSSEHEHDLHYYISNDFGQSFRGEKEYVNKDLFKTKLIGSVYKDLKINKPITALSISSGNKTLFLGMNDFPLHEEFEEAISNYDEKTISNCDEETSENIISGTSELTCSTTDEETNISSPPSTSDLEKETYEDAKNSNIKSYKKKSLIKKFKKWFT